MKEKKPTSAMISKSDLKPGNLSEEQSAERTVDAIISSLYENQDKKV